MKIKAALLILLCLSGETWSQSGFMDGFQKAYLQQGLPYRENAFLDNLPIQEEYDFVVVGSGPGGSVLANRLSEVPQWTVLLLEAGPEPNVYNDIPLVHPTLTLGQFSKFYPAEKMEDACQALRDERCVWPAGEVVGGATIINALFYTRGHPSDFDGWAAQGNPGWSYKDVLPYFLKYEDIAIPSLRNSSYHGRGGPVRIEHPYFTKISARFIRAMKEVGYSEVDYNNPETMLGVGRSQTTMKKGKRVSALSAYLLPAKNRRNLHVTKNTPATRVLVDPESGRAYGVRFRRRGVEREVRARKEVILSAGTFSTPKLLMLSGIGPRQHLQSLGIPVIKDLPVGDQLQEHIATPFLSYFINASESILFSNILRSAPVHFFQWLQGNGGILSSNGAEALAYVQTPLAEGKPDIEFMFLPLTPGCDGGAMMRKALNIKDELFDDLWGADKLREGFTICPMMMYPKSRGKIRLRSKDFDDVPIIDSNFFDDPYDINVIVAGVREAQKLATTRVFREVGAKIHNKPLGTCKQHPFDSDAYWECAIRSLPFQIHHQCCTARMGPDPRTSVVDPRLRVHGLRGLRVVDASVMPRIPGPHTMAPVYMIGEKAADLIKEDWS